MSANNDDLISNIEQGERLLSQLRLSNFHITQQGPSTPSNELPRQMKQVRDDEVRNNAGEKEATDKCLDDLTRIIKQGKGIQILNEILKISAAGSAPKQNPLLYALALCARYNIKDRRKLLGKIASTTEKPTADYLERLFDEYILSLQQASLMAVNEVCNIPTHLFAFVKCADMFSKKFSNTKGWGRGMKKAVSEWYLSRSPDQLAMHITKYKNREGKNAQNDLKNSLVYDQIFCFACTGALDEEKRKLDDEPLAKRSRYNLTPEMIAEENTDWKDEEKCASMIKKYGLVREHIPTDLLNSLPVWAALLEAMPMTSMIRNLSKMSAIGLIDGSKQGNEMYENMVISNLVDEDRLHRAKIHPISVLLASATYSAGHGLKGSLKWTVNEKIKQALDKAFILAFKNVIPTNQRYCLALDVSGSMSSSINGGALSCRDASAAMSAVFLRTEPKVECMAFCDTFVPLPFTKSMSIEDMVRYTDGLPFGSTDCAQPMIWALENQKEFDVFIVFTDCETWCGEKHPFEALKEYRQQMNLPESKLVVMAMTSTEFTIADPSDAGMLDVCGLDASVPELVRNFVLGHI
uniref:TROVE domain-containing protein n=1 Tax=Ditylenchus dipsaci TaxID=166011 RepID=A0A915DLA6_9BILA